MAVSKIKKLTRYIQENGIPKSNSGTEWDSPEWQELFKALKENRKKKENFAPLMKITKSLFELLPDAAFLIDKEALVIKCNQAVSVHLGYSIDELEGQPFEDIFSDKMLYEFFAEELFCHDRIMDIELELRSRDGRFLTYIMSGLKVPIPHLDNIYLCMGADISAMKKIENSLRMAKKKAEAASKAKSDFLANMSHEIRTPLNGIIGMNELMLTTSLDPEQRELSEMIKVSADALLTLLNDILDFSKIEAGKLLIERRPFSIMELAQSASTIVAHQIKAKQLDFELQFDKSIPDRLIGDVSRIRQVLVNLLGNAVKFTEKGKVTLNIQMHNESAGRYEIKFSVTDTGIGIPKSKQETIFNEFTQADVSTTREYGGTGLGLSICHRLIHLMGGELHVFSLPGEGATFWFVLPFKTAEEQMMQKEDNSDELPAISLKILLVDDNVINQKVASRLLVKAGHTVEIAGNGLEAIKKFRTDKFDVVLMDLQMPVMGGIAASREIRKIETDVVQATPILALTANVLESQKEECLNAGMNGFLTKPIRLKELFKALKQVHHKGQTIPPDDSIQISL